MKRTLVARLLNRRLIGALAGLGIVMICGCGSDDSTRPEISATLNDEVVGEVPLPEDLMNKFPVPAGFNAVVLADCVQLGWEAPAMGYTAVVHCDGVQIAAMEARIGHFDDTCMTTGMHRYSLCFTRGNTVGPQVHLMVSVVPPKPDKEEEIPLPENGRIQ
jgi:hypothetical protein